jgi:hypothetical protein
MATAQVGEQRFLLGFGPEALAVHVPIVSRHGEDGNSDHGAPS